MQGKPVAKIIEGCIIFLIIFTPLALGTVQDWSMSIMRLVTAFALGAWLFSLLTPQTNQTIEKQKSVLS